MDVLLCHMESVCCVWCALDVSGSIHQDPWHATGGAGEWLHTEEVTQRQWPRTVRCCHQEMTSRSEQRCGVCGAVGHLGFDCPETEAFSYKMADVKCTICGDRGHVASDCKQAAEQHKKAGTAQGKNVGKFQDGKGDGPRFWNANGLCYYQLCSLQSSGYKQSTHAGKKISQQLERCSLPPVVAIYSSPTARTMGTAAAIAKEVGLSQVLPAYGLNCCAAAKMTGAG
eukprot:Skav209966  [mRNA]  locus=scaffold4929:15969:17504:- [translate_table: standard]